MTDIDDALDALADAQRSGDFAAQGRRWRTCRAAVKAYQDAQAAGDGDAAPGG